MKFTKNKQGIWESEQGDTYYSLRQECDLLFDILAHGDYQKAGVLKHHIYKAYKTIRIRELITIRQGLYEMCKEDKDINAVMQGKSDELPKADMNIYHKRREDR